MNLVIVLTIEQSIYYKYEKQITFEVEFPLKIITTSLYIVRTAQNKVEGNFAVETRLRVIYIVLDGGAGVLYDISSHSCPARDSTRHL